MKFPNKIRYLSLSLSMVFTIGVASAENITLNEINRVYPSNSYGPILVRLCTNAKFTDASSDILNNGTYKLQYLNDNGLGVTPSYTLPINGKNQIDLGCQYTFANVRNMTSQSYAPDLSYETILGKVSPFSINPVDLRLSIGYKVPGYKVTKYINNIAITLNDLKINNFVMGYNDISTRFHGGPNISTELQNARNNATLTGNLIFQYPSNINVGLTQNSVSSYFNYDYQTVNHNPDVLKNSDTPIMMEYSSNANGDMIIEPGYTKANGFKFLPGVLTINASIQISLNKTETRIAPAPDLAKTVTNITDQIFASNPNIVKEVENIDGKSLTELSKQNNIYWSGNSTNTSSDYYYGYTYGTSGMFPDFKKGLILQLNYTFGGIDQLTGIPYQIGYRVCNFSIGYDTGLTARNGYKHDGVDYDKYLNLTSKGKSLCGDNLSGYGIFYTGNSSVNLGNINK